MRGGRDRQPVARSGSRPAVRHAAQIVGKWLREVVDHRRVEPHVLGVRSLPCVSWIARATTSRGARSASGCTPAMNATPSSSRRTAPSPRNASESSGRGIDGWCSAVGWNCTNSRSAHATPAFSASAMPSPVESVGIGRDREALAGAAGREHDVDGAHELDLAVGPQREHAGAAVALDEQLDREPALADLDRRCARPRRRARARSRRRSRRRPRARRGRASGRLRGRAAARSPSGPGSVSNCAPSARELADPVGALGHEHAHRVDVAQPGARGQRVGEVQLGRVGRGERGGDATLRVARRRVRQLALREHERRQALAARRGARSSGPRRRSPARGRRTRSQPRWRSESRIQTRFEPAPHASCGDRPLLVDVHDRGAYAPARPRRSRVRDDDHRSPGARAGPAPLRITSPGPPSRRSRSGAVVDVEHATCSNSRMSASHQLGIERDRTDVVESAPVTVARWIFDFIIVRCTILAAVAPSRRQSASRTESRRCRSAGSPRARPRAAPPSSAIASSCVADLDVLERDPARRDAPRHRDASRRPTTASAASSARQHGAARVGERYALRLDSARPSGSRTIGQPTTSTGRLRSSAMRVTTASCCASLRPKNAAHGPTIANSFATTVVTPSKCVGPGRAAQVVGEVGDVHRRERRPRVHLGDARREHAVDALRLALREVAGEIAGVAVEVLVRRRTAAGSRRS